jgi:hypothetical protein
MKNIIILPAYKSKSRLATYDAKDMTETEQDADAR